MKITCVFSCPPMVFGRTFLFVFVPNVQTKLSEVKHIAERKSFRAEEATRS